MFSLTEIYSVIGLAVLAYMTTWFGFAVLLRRRDVIDSAWGLGFVMVAWIAYILRNNDSVITTFSAVLVTVWGVRLFLHISSRNWRKTEDYRYRQLSELGSITAWLKTYTNVFLLQGALMIIVSSPVIALMYASNEPVLPLAVMGLAVWLFGILFETVADYQLRRFISTNKKKDAVMDQGLWRYSRHPNYFGEATTWAGATIVSLAYAQWWGVIGAIVITLLVTKISGIPLLEKRFATNPAFQKYAARTSRFIPRPVKIRERL